MLPRFSTLLSLKNPISLLLMSSLLFACASEKGRPGPPSPKPEGERGKRSQASYNEALTQVNLDGETVPKQLGHTFGDGSLSLASDALKSQYILPLSATCDGQNKGERLPLHWSNVPAGTQSFALAMYHYPNPNDRGDFAKAHVYLSQFDIPANRLSLPQGENPIGQFGPNTVNGQLAYSAPCSKDSNNQLYSITLYALSVAPGALGISPKAASLETLYQSMEPYILADASLTLQRKRFNPKSNEHVPTDVAKDCQSKSDDFAAYAHKVNVSCTDTELLVTTKTFLPDRSQLDEDKSNVGISSWIGRVPIPTQATWRVPLKPEYLDEVQSNLNIHDAIGISVEGIPILHYAKEKSRNEIAQIGEDYSDRDTVLLGEIDQCGAHAGNGEDYHYHMAPLCLMDTHDPSKPLAYMFDGLPLYFGTAGGQASKGGTNYGAGRYTELNYLPDEVQRGRARLDECNAYDLNGDGSEYVYYTTQEAPYTIGCYRAKADQSASVPRGEHWRTKRNLAWSGSDVRLTDSDEMLFDGKTWSFIEVTPGQSNRKIRSGKKAMILYRALSQGESGYQANLSCFAFRYRLDMNDSQGLKDIESTHCR